MGSPQTTSACTSATIASRILHRIVMPRDTRLALENLRRQPGASNPDFQRARDLKGGTLRGRPISDDELNTASPGAPLPQRHQQRPLRPTAWTSIRSAKSRSVRRHDGMIATLLAVTNPGTMHRSFEPFYKNYAPIPNSAAQPGRHRVSCSRQTGLSIAT